MNNELEQMSPNQRRAHDARLATLETMAAMWAAEVGLHEIAAKFAAIDDPAERATRIAAMIRQGFSEGAYRHYIDHKDAIAQTVANLARMAELESQIATLTADACTLCNSTGHDMPCAYPTEINRQQAKRISELTDQLATLTDSSEMVRRAALEEAAKVCDEYAELSSAEKDSALLVGKLDLSNAMSGEPRAAAFLAAAIRALQPKDAREAT